MITTGKKSKLVKVFTGSPWEVASVSNLLKAAYINASVEDKGTKDIHLSVPSEHYTAAMRLINNRVS